LQRLPFSNFLQHFLDLQVQQLSGILARRLASGMVDGKEPRFDKSAGFMAGVQSWFAGEIGEYRIFLCSFNRDSPKIQDTIYLDYV
jgi:hypothetical protein